ncbi:MAG: hypothetical protein H6625_00715 [Bdellovibrionaceae bacterium]|nr:hypothetical protein [Pseudobdellovibrionaceae bacterium]
MIYYLIIFLFHIANADTGVRRVSSSSCDVIRVNLGIGMTTQIVLEQAPKVTLFADKKHFKISTNPLSPRSLAIIPYIDSTELDMFKDSKSILLAPKPLASALDNSFRTNLFVFFENNNQLLFELRFVVKKQADNILKVTQIFNKDCGL